MNRNSKHRPLVVIATVLFAVPVVALGAPVGFQEFVRLGDSALGLPCRIATESQESTGADGPDLL